MVFLLIWRFFRRLRQSENLLAELQDSQTAMLEKLELNAGLENELLESFRRRQAELSRLDLQLEGKIEQLRSLLAQAEQVSRSPRFLRELILNGSRGGRSPAQLAKSTGLSVDEVELILAQAGV
ncbi:MAG: hypothetical protein LBQ63_01465 [Deltaproteobacteria bacterium]|nr:hypothetical protein [Deltaproteobacteria bacterium]